MKKLILLSLLALTACHKDNINLISEHPDNEIVSKDSSVNVTPQTREEILFLRLANACLRGEESCDVSDLHIPFTTDGASPAEYETLYAQFIKQYPFIFHLLTDGSISVNSKLDNPSELQRYNFEYSINLNTLPDLVVEMEKSLEAYYATLHKGMSDAEVAYAIYQRLIQGTVYKESIYSAHAHGPLTVGEGICQGYSLAYCLLMENLGFRTDYIRGPIVGTSGHMWNRILIDKEWYNLDATWDDNSNDKVYAACGGSYFLTSDTRFYHELEHAIAYQIPKIPDAVSYRFDSENYFFRKNTHQTNATYRNGYWYYLSIQDMCIYRSLFDGSNKQTIRKLDRPTNQSILWQQIVFSNERIHFFDRIDNQDYICSIGYNGEGFKTEKTVTLAQAIEGILLKQNTDSFINQEHGSVTLRAEIALAKFKDAYYHGTEDYGIPVNPQRIEFVSAITEAEEFLKTNIKDEHRAKQLYEKLNQLRTSYTQPPTSGRIH